MSSCRPASAIAERAQPPRSLRSQTAGVIPRARPAPEKQAGFQRISALQLASSVTLAESSIDIFLWEIPLNSHFAGAHEVRTSGRQPPLQRGLAPPVMPPSIMSSAPVM
jgi:hypothetical protein